MNKRKIASGISPEAVYQSDRERLIQLACRVVESRAIAEEIVQESWIRWLGKSYPDSDARPVFRRIVANLATDWYRSRRTEQDALKDVFALRPDVASTEATVIARNELSIIVKTLLKMSDRHIKAFRMRTLDGRKYADIASELDVSVGYAFRLIEQVMVEIYLALDP